jgi:hypothetical protein
MLTRDGDNELAQIATSFISVSSWDCKESSDKSNALAEFSAQEKSRRGPSALTVNRTWSKIGQYANSACGTIALEGWTARGRRFPVDGAFLVGKDLSSLPLRGQSH